MNTYVDFITIRAEAVDEDGNPTGVPDPIPGVAATAGGSRVVDGQREFLCRVRARASELPEGIEFFTPAEFRAAHPDVWTAFGLDPYTTTVEAEDGTTEEITVEPSIPVFL